MSNSCSMCTCMLHSHATGDNPHGSTYQSTLLRLQCTLCCMHMWRIQVCWCRKRLHDKETESHIHQYLQVEDKMCKLEVTQYIHTVVFYCSTVKLANACGTMAMLVTGVTPDARAPLPLRTGGLYGILSADQYTLEHTHHYMLSRLHCILCCIHMWRIQVCWCRKHWHGKESGPHIHWYLQVDDHINGDHEGLGTRDASH